MADEPEGPPIGTAQNAADVARKAEMEAHEKALAAAESGDTNAYVRETDKWAQAFVSRLIRGFERPKTPSQLLRAALDQTLSESRTLTNDEWFSLVKALSDRLHADG